MPSFTIKGKKYKYSGKSFYERLRREDDEYLCFFDIPFRNVHINCDNDKLNIPKLSTKKLVWKFHSAGIRKKYEYMCFECCKRRITSIITINMGEFIIYSHKNYFYIIGNISGQTFVETKRFVCCNFNDNAPNFFEDIKDNPDNFQSGAIIYQKFINCYNEYTTNKYSDDFGKNEN